MADSITDSYRLGGKLEYQIYPEEYFSGCDVSIYFGNAWVDEIVSITYALAEMVQPIYGYNSRVFDAVMRSSRMIQGTFRINFRKADYLHTILLAASEKGPSGEIWRTPTSTRQQVISEEEFLSRVQAAKTPEEFDELFNSVLEQWGAAQTLQSIHPALAPNPTLAQDGFDIVVMYGATENRMYSGQVERPLTSHVIKNVHLMAVNHVINNNGEPVFEDYSFIARDIINI